MSQTTSATTRRPQRSFGVGNTLKHPARHYSQPPVVLFVVTAHHAQAAEAPKVENGTELNLSRLLRLEERRGRHSNFLASICTGADNWYGRQSCIHERFHVYMAVPWFVWVLSRSEPRLNLQR